MRRPLNIFSKKPSSKEKNNAVKRISRHDASNYDYDIIDSKEPHIIRYVAREVEREEDPTCWLLVCFAGVICYLPIWNLILFPIILKLNKKEHPTFVTVILISFIGISLSLFELYRKIY